MFIDVKVKPEVAKDPALAKKLVEVCPVNIFALKDDGTVRMLCDLCIQAAPEGGVRVLKLYEE